MGGSAEVDGECVGCWELSSARTTFAGAPRGIQNVKGALRPWITMLVKVCRSNTCNGKVVVFHDVYCTGPACSGRA